MAMLQGNTYLKPVQVLDEEGKVISPDRVVKGEFVFGDIYKYYGAEDSDVVWVDNENAFVVPLTEEDTFSLEGVVECQARLLLDDGSVSGSVPEAHDVYTSKSKTRLSEGGAGGESGEILVLRLLNGFSSGGGISQEIDPTVPGHVKAITSNDIARWNAKIGADELVGVQDAIEDLEKDKASFDYVDVQINNVREVAEGKTKSFTVATLTDLGTILGIDTSIVSDEYSIINTTITYKEQNIELKQGDLFLIIDTNVPDYWVSIDDMKIYKMETTKVDLSEYLKVRTGALGYRRIYTIESNGTQGELALLTNADSWSVPQRGTGGIVKVGTPVANNDATTKLYVDDLVKSLISATRLEDGSYSISINTEV